MRYHVFKRAFRALLLAGLGAAHVRAAAPASPQGVITARVYTDVGGTAVTDLQGSAKFPDSPDIMRYESAFELWSTGDINTPPASDVLNNYGSQLVGYFYPPTSGDYVFYLSSDDGSNLYLSTDDNPANKKLIAQEAGYSNVRGYTVIGGTSTVEAKCSQTFTGTQWPTKDTANGGAKITLVKGTPYYIETLHKEGGGGDNVSVSIDGLLPIPGTYLSSFDKTTGPLKIVTPPANQTVNAGQAAALKVVVDGTPPYTYQWKKNGTDVADATNFNFLIGRTVAGDAGQYTVAITGAQGSLTSAAATLTVNSDATPPTVKSVAGSASFTSLTVKFSEPVDPTTAQTAANYKLSGGLTVSAVSQQAAPNDDTVVLTTSTQTEGASLTLTVSNVKDIAGNVMAASGPIPFLTDKFAAGFAAYQRWQYSADPGAIDVLVSGLADGSIGAPTVESAVAQFGGPWGVADYYFARVFGFFTPPSDGNYIFFTASDDQSNVYLSTDDSPANKKLIAQEGGWSNQYQWTLPGSGDATTKRSDQFSGTEWPSGATITLKAGKKYYLEGLQKEGSGGDGIDVTYIKEGDADPAQDSTGMHMRGNVIGTYVDVNGAKANIPAAPASVQGVEGHSASFSVKADTYSPVSTLVAYQWLKNGQPISGATFPAYTTPKLALSDNNTKYSVTVSVPGVSTTSAEATLTVVADTFPPKPLVNALKNQAGTYDVGIGFDEDVEPVEAGKPANYSISAGTVTAFTPYKASGAVLTVSGLSAGTKYTVTVKNVADLKGNKITNATADFTVGKMAWGVVGGDREKLGNGVVTIGDNGFDIYSDGATEWNNYDESTFVYEQITGDFDKKLRVEYQDSSSQWARAGLIARDVTNFGVGDADQAGTQTIDSNSGVAPFDGKACRYQKVHVNPVTTVMGTAGNNSWEGNRRLETGGPCTSAGGGGTPLYPNAWCRLQRVGDLFTIYRSDDGVNWTQLGTTTFPSPMPATLYVGPDYSPENGNISDETLRGMWLAKFREYGDTFPATAAPSLGAARTATGLTLTYTGKLQSASAVSGPWTDVTGAASPYAVTTAGKTSAFYRAAP